MTVDLDAIRARLAAVPEQHRTTAAKNLAALLEECERLRAWNERLTAENERLVQILERWHKKAGGER